ncbi:DUF4345 domain-containing protein [Parvularcula sp. IMCC14364]|uniref:DUF4345 domain-containing protein n=1 Tax=Parvularcula sp. IMCC14364 TaxID=3067902 RepID=UPI00274147FC|nr:DUF4345 domain-containing protein [Parvularcula sp. IMCC14364]
MKRLITRTALVSSGALLGLVGGGLMIAPRAFLEMSHVVVEHDPGLMSELTAPSGILIITGAFMILGAIKSRFAYLALSVGAIVYGSYGIGRLVSMGLHGLPAQSLVTATAIELGIAVFLVALRLTGTSPKRNLAEAYIGGAIV